MTSIVVKAWSDPAFKQKLLADPAATLKAAGIDVPAGVTVRVVENTDDAVHFVLPAKPTGPLSDSELEKIAGGIPPPTVAYVNVFGGPLGGNSCVELREANALEQIDVVSGPGGTSVTK